MKSKNLNIFELIDSLISKEKQMGIIFNSIGYPVFEKWMFYDKVPKEMIPYRHRKSAVYPKDAAICFYEPDEALYKRINRLDETAEELKKYACFVGFDLSIFSDFLKPFQEFYALANLVIDIYLILNGIKMIPNLRYIEDGQGYFDLFIDAPVVCCGTLGCSKLKTVRDMNKTLISKYASDHNDQLVIQYGSNLTKERNTISFAPFGWRSKNEKGR